MARKARNIGRTRDQVPVPEFLIDAARSLAKWSFAGATSQITNKGIIVTELHLSWRGGAGVPEQPFRESIPKGHSYLSFHQDIRPSESGTLAKVWIRTLPPR